MSKRKEAARRAELRDAFTVGFTVCSMYRTGLSTISDGEWKYACEMADAYGMRTLPALLPGDATLPVINYVVSVDPEFFADTKRRIAVMLGHAPVTGVTGTGE